MFGFLLGLPATFKVALVSLALVGALQVRHWIQVRGLEREIATVTQALDREKAATADLRVAVSDVQANRDRLSAAIREQNDSIALMQAAAKAAASAADARVARALRQGVEEAAGLRRPETRVPPGHAAMNEWLVERFR